MKAADLVRHYRRGILSRGEMIVGCVNALTPETRDATVAALAEVGAEQELWRELERADLCGGVAQDDKGVTVTLGEGAREVLRREGDFFEAQNKRLDV
jgi:hypothetical protein